MPSMNMDFAEGWRPNPGDMVVGKVTEVDRGWSSWTNSYYPIVTIQPDGKGKEPVAVHAFHTSLRNKLAELRPVVGEKIGIQYKGEQPLKSDARRTVHVYVARVEGRSAASVWDSLGGPTNRAPVVDEPAQSDIPNDTDKNNDDLPF